MKQKGVFCQQLTIEEGTQVLVSSGDTQAGGTWSDRAELIVHGTLNVNGAAGEGNEVTFHSADQPTNLTAWGGLRIESGGSATFRYAHIENATQAVQLNGTIGPVDWGTNPDAATLVDRCLTGLYASSLNGQILQNVDINEVTTGVRLEACVNTTVRNISVTWPTGNIVEVNGGAGNWITNTTLVGNRSYQTAIRLNNTPATEVSGNLILDAGIGIQAVGDTSGIAVMYNSLWNLLIKQFAGLTPSPYKRLVLVEPSGISRQNP